MSLSHIMHVHGLMVMSTLPVVSVYLRSKLLWSLSSHQ